MDPLKTINIPNTETMCSFSLHFQTSVAPYEQHLSALEENQEPVAANWQGDASVAYEKTNQQLVSIGRMHIAQMQQASHIFDHTANLFDEGKGLQDMAQWQWGMGMAAETALAFPVASSWYVLAQKTQEGALAMVESARAYFNSGFAALHEKMTTLPSVTSMHDMKVVQGGVSMPKGTSPHAGSLPTPPLTPPATPPLKPTAAHSWMDSEHGWENEKHMAGLTHQPQEISGTGVPAPEAPPPAYEKTALPPAKGEPLSFEALIQLLFETPSPRDLPVYSKTPQ